MNILIIEDEYSLADAIAETLKKEKFKEKIFERFYRVDKARNRAEKRFRRTSNY